MPTVGEGQPEHSAIVIARPLPGQPFGEERGSQVRGGERRAIQQPLAEPVILRGMAFRVTSSTDLGHVDHGRHTGLGGRLGEDGGGIQETGDDGIAEVGCSDAGQCRTHRSEVEQVAGDDLRAQLGERLGAGIVGVDERPHPLAVLAQFPHGVGTGLSGGRGDEVEVVGAHAGSFSSEWTMSMRPVSTS